MQKHNLQQYIHRFIELGYDDLKQLQEMSTEDLKEVLKDVSQGTKRDFWPLFKFYSPKQHMVSHAETKMINIQSMKVFLLHKILQLGHKLARTYGYQTHC